MRFTARVKKKTQVTIPISIKEAYDIHEDDYVELEMVKLKRK